MIAQLDRGPSSVRLQLHRVNWEELIKSTGYNIASLARACGCSVRTLQRFIAQTFQMCLLDFVSDVRLRHARELLLAGHRIQEVVFSLHYKQASHFTRCFKSRFGTTPSQITALAA